MKNTIFAKIKNLFSQGHEELNKIRAKNAALKKERGEIVKQPATREEAIAALEEGIRKNADNYRESFKRLTIMNQESAPAGALRQDLQDLGTLEFYCWLDPDLIKARMTEAIDAFLAATPPGLPREERFRQLVEIDSQLFQLECEEEALIEAGEANGMEILRRADCDPRAVLGIKE